MRMYDIILKKRISQELNEAEFNFLIKGYLSGEVADYQVAALLMAIFLNGMTVKETEFMTRAMIKSGDQIDLSDIAGIKVDKHSTGGVGDKTTLIVGPLVASVGIPVAKMSGRGLSHTGGTIDKLESIPGMNVNLTIEDFKDNVNKHKIAIAGQTGELASADKFLYQLRDVTATVDSVPLIASSIMSKKIASGADAIVLDVKLGKGAFTKDMDTAIELSKLMVGIGKEFNRKVVAVITDMDNPLGNMIGNSLEVIESIKILHGKGPEDLQNLCLEIAAQMVVLGKKASNIEDAKVLLQESIKSGKAFDKLVELVKTQGGDENYILNPELFPKSKFEVEVVVQKTGYVSSIDAEKLGLATVILGAGRNKKEDSIDYSAGIILKKKIGDSVSKGETIAIMHTNDKSKVEEANSMVLNSYKISNSKPEHQNLIKAIVTLDNIKIYN